MKHDEVLNKLLDKLKAAKEQCNYRDRIDDMCISCIDWEVDLTGELLCVNEVAIYISFVGDNVNYTIAEGNAIEMITNDNFVDNIIDAICELYEIEVL